MEELDPTNDHVVQVYFLDETILNVMIRRTDIHLREELASMTVRKYISFSAIYRFWRFGRVAEAVDSEICNFYLIVNVFRFLSL